MVRTAILVLAFLGSFSAASQECCKLPKSLRQLDIAVETKSRPPDYWFQTAEALTADILEDQWRLAWHERVILSGRLAQIWWKADRRRARAWFGEALAQIEYEPQNEEPQHKKERLQAGRVLLEVLPHEEGYGLKLADFLVRLVSEIPDNQGGLDLRHKLGSSILDVIRDGHRLDESIGSDVQDTVEFIRKLIALKDGNALQPAYAGLRAKNPDLADQVFVEALSAVRDGYPYDLMFALLAIAFPPDQWQVGRLPPEQLRRQTLAALEEAILSTPENQQQVRSTCRYTRDADRLLPQFPTEQQRILHEAIEGCMNAFPTIRLAAAASATFRELRTAEDYLRAAQEEPNLLQRVNYKQQAIFELQTTDPMRALDLLDGMSEQERLAMEEWDAERIDIAAIAVERLYKIHETADVEKLINETPSPLRPLLLLRVVRLLNHKMQRVIALRLLIRARNEMEQTQLGQANFFIDIFNEFARLMPSEAPDVFREAMLALNHVSSRSSETEWPELRPVDFVPEVTNLDMQSLSTATELLDPVSTRTTIYIGLLIPVLNQYVQALDLTRQKTQAARQRRPVWRSLNRAHP